MKCVYAILGCSLLLIAFVGELCAGQWIYKENMCNDDAYHKKNAKFCSDSLEYIQDSHSMPFPKSQKVNNIAQSFGDNGFKVVHENEKDKISLHSFVHYDYPNVLTLIKFTDKREKKDQLAVLYVFCDKWKIGYADTKDMIPFLKDEEKLKHWPVDEIEFKKGTVNSYLFNYFCTQLHRNTPWIKL